MNLFTWNCLMIIIIHVNIVHKDSTIAWIFPNILTILHSIMEHSKVLHLIIISNIVNAFLSFYILKEMSIISSSSNLSKFAIYDFFIYEMQCVITFRFKNCLHGIHLLNKDIIFFSFYWWIDFSISRYNIALWYQLLYFSYLKL